MSLAFLLTSLIVVASPGTGVLYTLAAALTRGALASVAAAFGCTLGILPAMCAAMLGLAAVLHTSALAFSALKWCGVIYLLYMAWQALRETGALAGAERRLHVDDVCRVRALRPVCGAGPRSCREPAQRDEMVAARLCRRLRAARRQTCIRGALARLAARKIKKAGKAPAVFGTSYKLDARAER